VGDDDDGVAVEMVAWPTERATLGIISANWPERLLNNNKYAEGMNGMFALRPNRKSLCAEAANFQGRTLDLGVATSRNTTRIPEIASIL